MMVSVLRYGGSAELHPILAITETSIIIGEYSCRVFNSDGSVELLGLRKRVRLDRTRLEAGEEIYRRDVWYNLVSGGDVTIDGTCLEVREIAGR